MFNKDGILRAAAWKIQTSPNSSKKSTSILFHKRNPYVELFSKMEFKRFSEFYFSRNRGMSAFAQMGLGAKPKIGKFCECWAASQSKIRKEIETLFYIKSKYAI